ncbi:GNAT family N-acetyltransferase [bacterium]|nr:GNAT family N-acetyltransferase [bacterium]
MKLRFRICTGSPASTVQKKILAVNRASFPDSGSAVFDHERRIHAWLQDDRRRVLSCLYIDLGTATVWNVCTDPSFRRQGLMSLLMKETLRAVRTLFPVLHLHVRKENKTALRAYKKLRFRVVGDSFAGEALRMSRKTI